MSLLFQESNPDWNPFLSTSSISLPSPEPEEINLPLLQELHYTQQSTFEPQQFPAFLLNHQQYQLPNISTIPIATPTEAQSVVNIEQLTSSSLKPLSQEMRNDSKGFWNKPGMDMFIRWVTDPYTYKRLSNPRPVIGQRAVDIYLELANSVNIKHRTNWDADTVKSKLQYARKKYDAARHLAMSSSESDTDEETLFSKVRSICPYFEELHRIWSECSVRNPPYSKEYSDRAISSNQVPTTSSDNECVDSTLDELSDRLSTQGKIWFDFNIF
jgi:hypothetical protein